MENINKKIKLNKEQILKMENENKALEGPLAKAIADRNKLKEELR